MRNTCSHEYLMSPSYGGKLCRLCGKPEGLNSDKITIDRALLAELIDDHAAGFMSDTNTIKTLREELAASPADSPPKSERTFATNSMCKHWTTGQHADARETCGYCVLEKRIAELEAELAALKNQDPIGIIRQRIDGVGGLWVQWTTSVSSNAKLYAAAGAREKPES